MHLADVTPPDTQAARAAHAFAAERQTPAMLNHCIRSWLWAVGFAERDGSADIDRELLYVAALLHDIGLIEAFDNHTLSYEDAGGHVAAALTAGAGWPVERRQRVHDVIVRHNWPKVDPALDAEGHLLEIATGLDISGVGADTLPLAFQREVLTAYPRLTIAAEFGACVQDQATRKPTTQAARIVANGVVRKLAENPLETRGAAS
jgi:cyanamide hydratase family protein with HD domain